VNPRSRPSDDGTSPDLRAILAGSRVVPVIVSDDPGIAGPLSRALLAGGIGIAEVTLRTPNALRVLAGMASTPGLVAGAGTVLNARQAQDAISCGARFLVSPGYSPSVNQAAADAGVPVLPGVATATEMTRAVDDGHAVVKYFPAAASGGPAALRALSAPFGMLEFVPTGGITQASATTWLELPAVIAVGGSWMVAPDLLGSRDFTVVTALALAATRLPRHETGSAQV
jgi:2-dehydro-3-deoxyphosphogluconate aldolase/(4S)-4-hydroxy-2-oxoglutarate aldolase